jgi:hypothetical protein
MPTFAVCRILGNDLPPRHAEGQTLANVSFILKHEPVLPHARKIWLVQNIIDKAAEAKLLELLQTQGDEVIHIPFDPVSYRQVLAADVKTRLLTVIPLNRMRNFVMDRAREYADWILPLDGNCIFDQSGWTKIKEAFESRACREVFAIPMIRLSSNEQFFSEERHSLTAFEPQICLSAKSAIRFNERRAYGDDSKVELLHRAFPKSATRFDQFGHTITGSAFNVGIIYRLSSGVHDDCLVQNRHALRLAAIKRLLGSADAAARSA